MWANFGMTMTLTLSAVCPFKTCPCVRSKRPRLCRHHAHMCFNMCAWCRYTRRRFERTHGDVLSGHTGVFPVCHTTHTRHHHTHHNNTEQHTTTRSRQTDRDRENKRRQDEGREKARDERRQDERQEKTRGRQEKRREEKRQDEREQKRDTIVVVWFFLFFSKLPDPRIISNFQN